MDKRNFCLKIVFRLCKMSGILFHHGNVPLEAVSPFKEMSHEFYQNSDRRSSHQIK